MNKHMRKLCKLFRLICVRRFRRGLINGVAAAVEHTPVLRLLNQNKCRLVVDVGANVGQFSLAVREYIPRSEIIAFEPLAKPAGKYEAIFSGDELVTLFKCAVGLSNETKEMHVSRKDDSSSLLPITDVQNSLFPGTAESHVEAVEVRTLHSLINNSSISGYSMLKIDVQGFELGVLKGCEGLMQKFSAIYVECSFVELYDRQALAYEIIGFLRKYDFILDGVYNPCYDKKGRAIQADFFFVSRRDIA